MCSPTMLLVASTVASVGGQVYATTQANKAKDYNAAVATQNAQIADMRAKDAIERGQLEEEQALREGTALRKQQEAGFAAGSIDAGYGSPLDIIVATAANTEIDASIVRANAEREAEDFEFQATNYRNEAAMQRASKTGPLGMLFGAAGTALSGASSISRYRSGVT